MDYTWMPGTLGGPGGI